MYCEIGANRDSQAGVDKVHRDVMRGHSLKGMGVHYMAPSEEDLRRAVGKYKQWVDEQFATVNQNVDQERKKDSAAKLSP